MEYGTIQCMHHSSFFLNMSLVHVSNYNSVLSKYLQLNTIFNTSNFKKSIKYLNKNNNFFLLLLLKIPRISLYAGVPAKVS